MLERPDVAFAGCRDDTPGDAERMARRATYVSAPRELCSADVDVPDRRVSRAS